MVEFKQIQVVRSTQLAGIRWPIHLKGASPSGDGYIMSNNYIGYGRIDYLSNCM